MVVDVDAIELLGRYRGLDHGGVGVSAKAHKSDLSLSSKLFHDFHAAALSQRPIQRLHSVDAVERDNVHILHLMQERTRCTTSMLLTHIFVSWFVGPLVLFLLLTWLFFDDIMAS